MRLDSLVRLIDAADFMAFRELALECLEMKGYEQVVLTDGWSDGGTDVRAFQLPPNPTAMAFQITVDRDWKGKLREDSTKVHEKLKLDHMTLVASRRIPEAEFQSESERIWQRLGVRVTKIDGPAIASAFFLEGSTTRVLQILGIDIGGGEQKPESDKARADAAYSFVFFGNETHRFREATIESAIVTVGARRPEPLTRDDFEREVQQLLQLPDSQAVRVTAVVDRMIQAGDLTGPDASIELSPKLRDAGRAIQLLRESEWNDLRGEVEALLLKRTSRSKIPDEAVEAVLGDLGAVLLDSAHTASAALESQDTQTVLSERIRTRLRHLNATLDTFGSGEGANREALIEDLAELAGNSPIGRCVMSGELFFSLSAGRMPQLIRALGARSGVTVLLDSSVAIPMLCALLYHPVRSHFSMAAHHAYRQLQTQGVELVLPVDYLEEASTHLIRAFSDYEQIVDLDPDLVGSENAYVSHYASLGIEGKSPGFSDYLRSFGLDDAVRQAEFYAARDALKPRLERLFDRYSITARAMGRPSSESRRRAEECIAYAIHDLGLNRPDVLVRHDVRTLAYLNDTDRSGDSAYVLCTWDSLHFRVRERESADWQVLNPPVLGDILSLAAGSELGGHIAAPTVLARSLSDEAAQHGAEVWDTLVRLERGSMHDAELLAQARAFKEEYIGRLQSGQATQKVSVAWAAWKDKHYTKPAGQQGAEPEVE